MSKAYRKNLNDGFLMKEIESGDKDLGKSLYDVKEVFAEEGGDNTYATSLEELRHDKVFRAATHVLRLYHKQYEKFVRSLNQAASDVMGTQVSIENMMDGKPFMIPGEKPEDIIVFPTLLLNKPNYEHVSKVSWLTYPDVLRSFYWAYRADMDKDDKKKAWDGFKARALKRVWKRDTLTVERALTRWTRMGDTYSAAQIRDIATAYVETLKPVEITFTKTPEDFLTMYSSGPESCMALTKGERSTAWQVLIKAGLHPASLYGYSPHCKGAYIIKNKVILARAVCFESIKTPGVWEHGRMYASSPRYKTQFTNALKDMGIMPLTGTADGQGAFWEKKYDFEIPGVALADSKGIFAMPMPYFDNHSRNLFVEFDKKRSVFLVHVNSGQPTNVPGDQVSGYVLSNRLESVDCESCGIKVLASKAVQTADGEHAYCSGLCAQADSYVHAMRSDGNKSWIHSEDAIYDVYSGGKGGGNGIYFTNAEAAYARSAFPFASSLDELPEDGSEKFTMCKGIPIKYEGAYYRLEDSAFTALSHAKQLEPKTMRIDEAEVYIIKSNSENVKMSPAIDIKTQKVVLIEENFAPISEAEIIQMLNL